MQQEADVLICLEEQIRNRCERIIREAEEKAKTLRKQAEQDAQNILAQARAKTEAKLIQIRSRKKSQASLEAGQIITRVKAEAVQEAIKLAGSRLQSEQTSPRYKAALEKFLTESLDALKPSNGPFRVLTRRDDESLIKDLLTRQHVNASVESGAQFSGGIEIIDEKSHMRVVNTFESRLRQGFESISDRVRKVLRV